MLEEPVQPINGLVKFADMGREGRVYKAWRLAHKGLFKNKSHGKKHYEYQFVSWTTLLKMQPKELFLLL